MNENEPRRIQSIEVGFRVLRVIIAAEGPMRLRDIAAAADMPASKAHLYLVSFIREGLIEQDPVTQHYGMGRFAVQLGLAALSRTSVTGLARDELPVVREATQCGAYISMMGNRGPTIALALDGPSQGSLGVRIGYVLPLATSATGRMFLAHLAEVEVADLLPGGSLSGTPGLSAHVETARRQGYAMVPGTRQNPGFFAMSAPIFGFSGVIVATLTLNGSKALYDDLGEAHFAEPLTAAAHRITHAAPPPVLDIPRALSAHM